MSGGGAHNPVIMGQLAAAFDPVDVMPASVVGVDVDAKEAYAFAILAYESWHRRSANLPSATGAKQGGGTGEDFLCTGAVGWRVRKKEKEKD